MLNRPPISGRGKGKETRGRRARETKEHKGTLARWGEGGEISLRDIGLVFSRMGIGTRVGGKLINEMGMGL